MRSDCQLTESLRSRIKRKFYVRFCSRAEGVTPLLRLTSVKLLQTIPGVGRRTAEVIVAILDDPQRFQNARQVSAYVGLVPDQRQSGQTNRLGKITRRGSELLRSALVEAAWAMLRYNPWAVKVYQRICGGQKTRKKTAIIALARKLLVRCWAMLRRKEPWQDETVFPSTATSSSSTTNSA